MPRIVVSPPPQASEQTRSFRTHASYIRAFRTLALGDSRSTLEEATARLHTDATAQLYRAPAVSKVCDRGQLFACLRRAWATARLLEHTHALAEDSEIVRLANSWGAVQAYYVLYGAVQALIVAEGGSRPGSHEPTKRQYVDLWTSRRTQIAPWTLAATAPGTRLAGPEGILSGPGRPLDLELHPWAAWEGDEAWDIAAKALRSTRQALVDDRLTKARREKLSGKKRAWRAERDACLAADRKPGREPRSVRLTVAERRDIADRVRPATLADYLYRLRIKANYEDVSVFSHGPTSDLEATQVGGDFVALSSATLLVHELRIAAIIGTEELVKAMDAVLMQTSTGTVSSLAQRRDLHARI